MEVSSMVLEIIYRLFYNFYLDFYNRTIHYGYDRSKVTGQASSLILVFERDRKFRLTKLQSFVFEVPFEKTGVFVIALRFMFCLPCHFLVVFVCTCVRGAPPMAHV